MKLLNRLGLVLCLAAFIQASEPGRLNVFQISSPGALQDFFAYSSDRIPFVSAHRGGPRTGYPENCIATFENTLSSVHAILEIDPHYTRDGAIVLMHDATLERTSTGTGKVSDYTLEELRALKLKDTEGNATPFSIPTLDEALEWAKGKTILVLDEKDVPIEARVRKIEEHHAEANAIVMAYTLEDARKCFSMNEDIVMEVMLGTMDKIKEFDASGVPWKNVVVFLSHNLITDPMLFDEIHKRGAMCMVGSSRNYDIRYTHGEIQNMADLKQSYVSMISYGADIIEADLAIEAGSSLKSGIDINKSGSSKSKYFQ